MIPCIADAAVSMLDERACRAWWLRRLHPSGPSCPECGISIIGPSSETWANDGFIHCRDCGKWFDNKTGTPLCGLRLSWQQLTLFVALSSTGMKTSKLIRLCRISDDTARRLAKRLGAAGA